MECKPIFSDDRGEYLRHYGVKGMKWHQHLFSTADDALARLGNAATADRPSDSSFTRTVKSLASKGMGKIRNSSTVLNGKQAVFRALSNASQAKALMDAGDRMSESERNALREKAYSEKKERVRKRREEAKKAGNPLWMFM